MRGRIKVRIFVLISLLVWAPLLGDNVKKSSAVLCTVVQATRCSVDGDCETGPPWNWNIPQFIEVDLIEKVLRTTKASGENRSTAVRNMEREDGRIFLQGVERGRGFSIVITEETGMASFAVAADGLTVAAFGACTPMAPRR